MPVTNYYSVEGEIIGEATGGVRTDYLTDALGSVTGTVDQTASVVNTYRYKPYGTTLAKTGTGADPIFGWVGSQGYAQTGKKYAEQYIRARHYSSTSGRWTSKDPLGQDGGDPNYYRYVGNDPVGMFDRDGQQITKKRPPQRGGDKPKPPPTTKPITESERRDCCATAKQKGLDEGAEGGVICCRGIQVSCYWPKPGKPRPRLYEKCALEHEDVHKHAIQCDGKEVCRPLPHPPFNRPGWGEADECVAYQVTVRCLVKAKADDCAKAKDVKLCKANYDDAIAYITGLRDDWCKASQLKPPLLIPD